MVMYLYADAVFEGGGVKAIGIVGGVCCFEERGYRWKRLAGTSAGALIAALLAADYRGYEIRRLILNTDYKKLIKKGRIGAIPILGNFLEIIIDKGIYDSEIIEWWIKDLLKEKGKLKFKDISIDGESRLKIIASDITRKEILVIPDDLVKYDIDPMEFEIARAVRMSISIPIYFKPLELKYGGSKSLIIDGGILSNFPAWIFDVNGIPRWPTIGFKLVEPSVKYNNEKAYGIVSYTLDIIKTIIEENDARYIKNSDFVRTITIPTLGVKTLDFDILKDRSILLYNSGYKSAQEFLKTWDFKRYISKYRTGHFPTRREMVML